MEFCGRRIYPSHPRKGWRQARFAGSGIEGGNPGESVDRHRQRQKRGGFVDTGFDCGGGSAS
jgi:hypothetical protein